MKTEGEVRAMLHVLRQNGADVGFLWLLEWVLGEYRPPPLRAFLESMDNQHFTDESAR